MIVDAILTILFTIPTWFISLLPLPDAPVWLESAGDYLIDIMASGMHLVTFIFPTEDAFQSTMQLGLSMIIMCIVYDIAMWFVAKVKLN